MAKALPNPAAMVDFIAAVGKFAEMSIKHAADQDAKLLSQQKMAAEAPALVERMLEVGLLTQHQKDAALQHMTDPDKIVGVFSQLLAKYAEESSARRKMAAMTQGEPDSSGDVSLEGRRGDLGEFRKSSADARFAEAIMGG